MPQKPTYAQLEQKVRHLKQKVAELESYDQILSGILEHTHMMAVYLDAQFNFVWVNQAYADTCRKAPSFFPGKNHFDLYPHAENQAIFQKVVDTGAPFYIEAKPFEFPDQPDRGVTYWDWGLVPVKDKSGKSKGLVFTLNEATARARAEESLRLSEARLHESELLYRTIFEKNRNPIAIIDTEGRYLEANQAFYDFTETNAQTLLKMHVFDFALPHKKEQQEMEHRPAWSSGGIFETEYSIGGRVKVLQLTITPIQYKGRDAVVGVGVDITHRREVEAALHASEERFRSAFYTSPDAINLNRLADGRYIDVNEGFTDLMGYTREDVIGETSLSLGIWKNPNDRKKLVAGLKKNGFVENLEARFVAKDGTLRYGLMSARVLNLADEAVIISITRDITDRKRLEQQLLRAQKMESIGSLAGGIAHDFNNILFPIVGMSEMLLEDLAPDSPEHESAQEIYKAGKRGRDLVRQILTFSRRAEHKMVPTLLKPVLEEVLTLSRSTLPSYIEIQQDIQSECGFIMADPAQMHQIAMNIITNAYHALEPEGGKISVVLKEVMLKSSALQDRHLEPGKYMLLSISDTGHGMSKDVLNKIFDPYFTTKPQGKGTGLSLAVVYGIVKEHQGDIKVQSSIGRGSTFSIYLPLMDKPPAAESPKAFKAFPAKKKNILLVDDEAAIVKLVQQMLERLGCHVSAYTSSLEALEAFSDRPDGYDLVISDMTMPVMTGDQLARKLIAIRPDIPIIICTGFSERMDSQKAAAMGIKGFLMKPIIKSEMADMLKKALDEGVPPEAAAPA